MEFLLLIRNLMLRANVTEPACWRCPISPQHSVPLLHPSSSFERSSYTPQPVSCDDPTLRLEHKSSAHRVGKGRQRQVGGDAEDWEDAEAVGEEEVKVPGSSCFSGH
ncbi:hypothetical protein DPEC_G00368060 [Dallia pectoralis]|nr:hypothetical protein DPEC_G00368060 [Dallia pectoralis]